MACTLNWDSCLLNGERLRTIPIHERTSSVAERVDVLYRKARLKGVLFAFTSEETNGRPKLVIVYANIARTTCS